jgi:hypothetical protein
MSQGTDAAAALKKQNAAVLSYAKQAKQLLNGQHAIAVRAARELRGHGARGRKLAALLLNGQAVQEDALTASALGSISH